jgi:hypothetical protein
MCVVATALFPTKCYAGIDVFNNGIYNEQYAGSIFGDNPQQNDHSEQAGSRAWSSDNHLKAPLSGQTVRPFDESLSLAYLPFERELQNEGGTTITMPDGDPTRFIPVGDGMVVIFLFMLCLLLARMVKNNIVNTNKHNDNY